MNSITIEEIRGLVLRVATLAAPTSLGDDQDLFESELLDSLAVVELIEILTEEYSMDFNDVEIDFFKSVTSIWKWVNKVDF